MAEAFANAHTSLQPEYSVYIYHHPENQHEGQNDWEMRTSTPILEHALHEARTLHNSQSYRKVEVKQRITDRKTAKTRDTTLKIFAHDEKARRLQIWFSALSAGFVLMAAWAALSLFL